MSQNLIEFLKVLTVVVTWSTLILVGRRAMLSLDKEEEDDKGFIDKPEDRIVTITTDQNSDILDYDGMGNYGRFPKKIERR